MKTLLYLLAASVAFVAWLAGLNINYYGIALVFAAIGYNLDGPKAGAMPPSGRAVASGRPRPPKDQAA